MGPWLEDCFVHRSAVGARASFRVGRWGPQGAGWSSGPQRVGRPTGEEGLECNRPGARSGASWGEGWPVAPEEEMEGP